MAENPQKKPNPNDPTNPAYYEISYKGQPIEPIDIIEAWNLDFSLGNALKYLWRYGKKSAGLSRFEQAKQDQGKAKWYLDRFWWRKNTTSDPGNLTKQQKREFFVHGELLRLHGEIVTDLTIDRIRYTTTAISTLIEDVVEKEEEWAK